MSRKKNKDNSSEENNGFFKEDENIPVSKGMQAIRNMAKEKSFKEDMVESILDSLSTDTTIKYIDTKLLESSPKEWNFFKPLDLSKFLILKKSIETEGLLHPIHVWNYQDRFIILSGHNRVKAFKELYEETKNDRYLKIPAKINKVQKLDKDKARMIVAIANTQRAITVKEEYETIKRFFDYNKNYRGIDSYMENYAEIEKATGKKLRTIQKAVKLNNLIPELMNMIGDQKNSISTTTADLLANFSKADQKFLYREFKNNLSYKLVKGISPELKRDEIREYFEYHLNKNKMPKKKKSICIPKEIEEEFDQMVEKLISKWEEENNVKWKY
jgi:ParB family chromosome partitioning protein